MQWSMRHSLWIVSTAALMLSTGCSVLYRSTSSQIAVHPEHGADVAISKDAWNWTEGFHYEQWGQGMTWVELDNKEPVHLIRLEQEGHFPKVHPLFPEARNPYKSVDAGAALGLAIVGLTGQKRTIQPGFIWGAFIGAAANATALFAQPKRVFQKAYYFEGLKKMPSGNPINPPLKVEGFHMHISAGEHSWHYFQNMDKYHKNRVEFMSASDESIEIEYSNLDEGLNATLQNQSFQPPGADGMFQQEEGVQISGQLIGVREHRVQNIVRYELTTEWWVYNPFQIRTDTAHISSYSNWALYNFSSPGFDRDLIAEGLDEALFQAMESDVFIGKLNRIEDLELEWTKDWDVITLDQPDQPAGKVSAALESVVTVAAHDGHGSGCIVSSDGYILTNYHVIADGELDYTVHFQNGRQRQAEVVRYHPLYDLALLKVDTIGLKPFYIDADQPIDVGEEAYALGTPYDIDLGASVTKGIISGKRKDGSRTLIQTDVSISPGNSGGALISSSGQLIGVVNEKVLGMGVEGIGFAIPAFHIADALMLEFR
jgi:S1-C subfamily serine protease